MSDIFIDTANIDDIKEFLSWGIVEGVTTNQKIFLKEKGCNFEVRAKQILDLVKPKPVSLEGPNDYNGILSAAGEYFDWKDKNGLKFDNVVVKVPMLGDGDGICAVKELSKIGVQTNVTACMTVNQAYLAACAGATYVSLFYNRMKDMKDTEYALSTIMRTMMMLENGDFDTELIVGSIRKPSDIEEILTGNPDIITIPPKILRQMPFCKKTEETLKEFEKAWEEFCKV